MTTTKAPAPQTNVRAPLEARDTLLRIGQHLRADPAFLDRLKDFLDEFETGRANPSLARRLADLEARLARLEAGQ